jgi:FtsH-binding integral membrane protein
MAFTRSQTFGRGSVADSAVAAHMQQVFNYMAGGVALSGVAAWLTLNNMAIMAMAANPITQLIFLAVWLGFGFFMQRILFSLPAAGALGAFAALPQGKSVA